jgi:acyl-CoA thioester hydrolase
LEHVERLRVAWADTDAAGRIHFTAGFRYAEAAEGGLLRRLSLLHDWGSYPRRRVEAEFRQPLHFDDELEVAIRPANVGTTSIQWEWEIRRDGVLCVTGAHTSVHVGSDGRPQTLPDPVRERLMGRDR